MTGGRYWFSNSALAIPGGSFDEDSCATESRCNPQTADVLALVDGQKYDISQLDDTLLEPLVEFALNGSTTEDVPEVYKVLEIEG